MTPTRQVRRGGRRLRVAGRVKRRCEVDTSWHGDGKIVRVPSVAHLGEGHMEESVVGGGACVAVGKSELGAPRILDRPARYAVDGGPSHHRHGVIEVTVAPTHTRGGDSRVLAFPVVHESVAGIHRHRDGSVILQPVHHPLDSRLSSEKIGLNVSDIDGPHAADDIIDSLHRLAERWDGHRQRYAEREGIVAVEGRRAARLARRQDEVVAPGAVMAAVHLTVGLDHPDG
mmetsp:Transcript_22607/g.59045  ORF Transcript_22607/g.59045 Transcript_22607/m.59045 type:complete len:229 (-) Transcript_22607:540-1226(-)